MSTLLESLAIAVLILFGFLAASWVGAGLIALAVVLLVVSSRLEP